MTFLLDVASIGGDNISSIFQNGHIFNFRDFNHINSLALSAKLKILIFENIS